MYCACTAHAQKRLLINFRRKFRHRHSIPGPDFCTECKVSAIWWRFPSIFFHFICWMSAIFQLPVCLTYWSRKYTTLVDPHVDNSHQVWSCDLVTLTFDFLTLSSWRTWRVTRPTLPQSLKTLRLSVRELWVITFPVGYHWKCVRGHWVCAESRDRWALGRKPLHFFWNPRSRFAYSL